MIQKRLAQILKRPVLFAKKTFKMENRLEF